MNIDDLPHIVRYELHQAQISDHEIRTATADRLLDHWLEYNGFIGYTGRILQMVRGLYTVNRKPDKA